MQRSIHAHMASALAALMMTTAAATAIAQTPTTPTEGMNFQQVIDRVVSQGYYDVREVERKSDKLYEIEARDKQGRRVELYVDARSGEILREKVKR